MKKLADQRIFLSGIAGTGMSSLAGLFCMAGAEVHGSDTQFYPPVGDVLKQLPVKLCKGFSAENIPPDTDLCVVGNIISRGNPEVEDILNRRREFCSMAEALYRFFIRGRQSIVVAGSHGKTTITSFIACMLEKAGLEPGYFIGGKPVDLKNGFSPGKGNLFVTEGDEYETSFFDRSSKFLKYHPDILVLTSCEYDHLDFFRTREEYQRSFANLVNQVPGRGLIVSNNDFAMNRLVTEKALTPVVTYGRDSGRWRISRVENREQGGLDFELKSDEKTWSFHSPLAGEYNCLNLTAGIITGMHLGIAPEVIAGAVSGFNGVARRMKLISRISNSVIYEDFAHHPTAVAATLESLKKMYPEHRLVCLFEPRSWSLRRNFFQKQLKESLSRADELALMDVYEKEKIPVESRLDTAALEKELERSGTHTRVFLSVQELKSWLKKYAYAEPTVMAVLSNGSFGGVADFLTGMGES